MTKTENCRAYELFKDAQAIEINGYLTNTWSLEGEYDVEVKNTDDNGHHWEYFFSHEALEKAEFHRDFCTIFNDGDPVLIKFFKLESIL